MARSVDFRRYFLGIFCSGSLLSSACASSGTPPSENDVPSAGAPSSGGTSGSGGSIVSGGTSSGGTTGSGGQEPDDGLPTFGAIESRTEQEFVSLRWNPRKGAIYSLDVMPEGGNYVAPCVGGTVLGSSLSFVFDGRCPSAGNSDLHHPKMFRLCSSLPKSGDEWDPATVLCTEASYDGGTSLEIATPLAADAPLAVRYPFVPGASYAMHVELDDGEIIDNCAGAAFLGSRTSLAFDGTCPTSDTDPGLASVKRIQIDVALGGHWEKASARRSGSMLLSSGTKEVFVPIEGFENHVQTENCGLAPGGALDFGSDGNLAAEVCSPAESSASPSYLKRRYVEKNETVIMAYPRSYTDEASGYTYSLFATPSGGFAPAGESGCSELNLLKTKDFKNYEVTQIERLCGYTRLDNGELTIIDGKMYVAYHTISGLGGCTADGNLPGREWLLRMKVSDDFASGTPTFHDVGGGNGFETIRRLCLPNESNDGFWEPMIYEAADGSLMVTYTDDTPSEAGDGKCNQYIRVANFSLTDKKTTSDVAVGDCPGDKRDGMPVVQKNSAGKYFMVIESLGAPTSEIVLLESNDGGQTFGNRKVIASVAADGGYGVGCPYLAFVGNEPFVSYYHLFTSPSGANFGAFMVRGFEEDLSLRSERVVEMRRRFSGADDLDILYWGGIHKLGNHLHLVGSNWSHPFVEAWVPLD